MEALDRIHRIYKIHPINHENPVNPVYKTYRKLRAKNSITTRSYASSCSPVADGRLKPLNGKSVRISTFPGFGKQLCSDAVESRSRPASAPDSSNTRLSPIVRANSQASVSSNVPSMYSLIPRRENDCTMPLSKPTQLDTAELSS